MSNPVPGMPADFSPNQINYTCLEVPDKLIKVFSIGMHDIKTINYGLFSPVDPLQMAIRVLTGALPDTLHREDAHFRIDCAEGKTKYTFFSQKNGNQNCTALFNVHCIAFCFCNHS